MMICII
jgi:hypothetical protein